MTIWHKILIGLIFLTIPVNFFFACRTLKTHQVWRSKIVQLEKQIAQIEQENHDLEFGVFNEKAVAKDKTGKTELVLEQKGIVQLEQELDTIMFQRGRVWFEAGPAINSETGVVTLEVFEPSPHNIIQGTILYCFDSTPVSEGGNYIGKFIVSQVEDAKIQLIPTMNCDNQGKPLLELATKLKRSAGAWNLYEKMPLDERALFASMDEKELKELMPETTVDEYIKDGKSDPDNEGSVYVRNLRDYEELFSYYASNRVRLTDLIQVASLNKKYLEETLANANLQKDFMVEAQRDLTDQIKTIAQEAKGVDQYLRRLNGYIASADSKIAKCRKDNQVLAASIKKVQFDAAKKFNDRIQKRLSVM